MDRNNSNNNHNQWGSRIPGASSSSNNNNNNTSNSTFSNNSTNNSWRHSDLQQPPVHSHHQASARYHHSGPHHAGRAHHHRDRRPGRHGGRGPMRMRDMSRLAREEEREAKRARLLEQETIISEQQRNLTEEEKEEQRALEREKISNMSVLDQLKYLLKDDFAAVQEEPTFVVHYKGNFEGKLAKAVTDTKTYLQDKSSEGTNTVQRLSPFIEALPYCLPIRFGFHSTETNSCYCPLSSKLVAWHEKFHLGIHKNAHCRNDSSRRKDAHPLLIHLKDKAAVYSQKKQRNELEQGTEDCEIYHRLTECFLQSLYSDYLRDDLHHKALYDINSRKFKIAEFVEDESFQAERRERERKLHWLQDQKERIEDKYNQLKSHFKQCVQNIEKIKNKEERSRQLALLQKEEHEAEFQRHQEELVCRAMEKLNIVPLEKNVEELTEKEISHYRKQLAYTPNMWRVSFQRLISVNVDRFVSKIKEHKIGLPGVCYEKLLKGVFDKISGIKRTPVSVKVYRDQSLQEIFDEWWRSKDEFFIGRPDDVIGGVGVEKCNELARLGQWLEKWDIHFYDGYTESINDQARDEGGPTRAFLSKVWEEFPGIKVGGVKLCVSERPIRFVENSNLEGVFQGDAEKMKQAAAYFRVFGRILLYCIAHGESIAAHMMPPLYQKYLLKGILPTSRTHYPLSELIRDTVSLYIAKDNLSLTEQEEFLDYILFHQLDSKSPEKNEETVRQQCDKIVIGGASIALNAVRDGMTLGAVSSRDERDCSVRMLVSGIPVEALYKLQQHKEQAWVENGFAGDEHPNNRTLSPGGEKSKGDSYNEEGDEGNITTYAMELMKQSMTITTPSLPNENDIPIDLGLLFFTMPDQAVDLLVLTKQKLRGEDILRRLKIERVNFIGADEHEAFKEILENQSLILSIENGSKQDSRKETGALKDIIMEHDNDEKWLQKFLHLITGLSYLPNDPSFQIVVEFNLAEDDFDIPQAHTCVNVLKFPGLAYSGDLQKFKEKFYFFFNEASVGNGFTME